MLIEDNDNDVELLKRELDKIFDSYELRVTDNKQDFIKLLDVFSPTVIISDYYLPAFTGLEALSVLKELSLHTPFIIVTGSINEETAVACMKAGASDYVLKDHLVKIGQAINTALEAHETKQAVKLADERLKQSRKKYSQLIENVGVAIYSVDLAGKFIVVNNRTAQYFDKNPEDFTGKTLWDFFPKHVSDAHFASISRVIKSGKLLSEDIPITIAGEELWFNTTIQPVANLDGTVTSAQVVAHDITQRKAGAEQLSSLCATQTTINQILELSLTEIPLKDIMDFVLEQLFSFSWLKLKPKTAIYLIDPEDSLLHLKAWKGLTEDEIARFSSFPLGFCTACISVNSDKTDRINPITKCAKKHFQKSDLESNCCMPLVSSGKVLGVLNFGYHTGFVSDNYETETIKTIGNVLSGIVQRKLDEKEKEKMRAQLIQSSKMAALGQLSAGVAHELNNPLTVIMGNMQFLLGSKQQNDNSDIFREVESAAQRCKKIVSDLLEFSRKKEFALSEIDLFGIIDRVLRLFHYQSDFMNVSVSSSLKEGENTVLGSATHLEQVFFNMVLNAAQAMPNGGKIEISSAISTDGKTIEIFFKDNGTGIPREYFDRLFEPFFTTKKTGTGLGLAVCYSILSQHNGEIKAESDGPGKGTTFIVRLPRVSRF